MRSLPIIALIPTGAAPPPAVVRHRAAGHDAPSAAAVEVPPGVTLLHLAVESPAGHGDTRAQARTALHALAERLARFGLRLADLVRLRVSLAGETPDGAAIFAAAWREAFGNAPMPDPPLITVVQVTSLGTAGGLVGLEATAARPTVLGAA